ncbi:EamA family transporter [Paenibacillus sp. GSMTC-2017]|uniref:DMT family transporter n=1 Tax=Paenibacillus sp. GSMTC-2017 TaxID=2794350 RepID=UPI0018D867CD|nr:DMT family transporter [Paenibacillus sp. GSMTC-2017]MBH5318349.1 EamA family transporter [Paenibacillus sp. GSMTC-2017]
MNDQNKPKLAYIAVVLNAVIIGFSFLFTKIALEHANPMDTLTYRFILSFGIMSIPVVLGKLKLNYRGKSFYKIVLLATMYPLAFFTFQSFGLLHATSSEGGILYAVIPVLTLMLASIFLKETTTILQKISIFTSVFGVLFIFIMKGSNFDLSNIVGIALLFMSCLVFAAYSVLAKSLLKTYRPAEITYLMLGIGFITFLIISLSSHTTAGTLHQFIAPLTNTTFILSILYLGVLSSLLTALMTNYALSKIDASNVSVFSNLSTIVAMIAGAIFLNETITLYSIIGSLLIIAGVLGTNMLGKINTNKKIAKGEHLGA